MVYSHKHHYMYASALPEVRLVKEPFSELEIGQRVTLTCVVTAYKLWHVVWTKESDRTPVIGDYSREGVHIKCDWACENQPHIYLHKNYQFFNHYSIMTYNLFVLINETKFYHYCRM